MYLITFMKLLLKLLGFDELITEIEYLKNKEKEDIKLINNLTAKLRDLDNTNRELEKQVIEFNKMYTSSVFNDNKLKHIIRDKLLAIITNDLNIMITNEDLF